MSKEEKKAMIESIAKKFMELDVDDKAYIAGYMVGKQEERRRWEQKLATATV